MFIRFNRSLPRNAGHFLVFTVVIALIGNIDDKFTYRIKCRVCLRSKKLLEKPKCQMIYLQKDDEFCNKVKLTRLHRSISYLQFHDSIISSFKIFQLLLFSSFDNQINNNQNRGKSTNCISSNDY